LPATENLAFTTQDINSRALEIFVCAHCLRGSHSAFTPSRNNCISNPRFIIDYEKRNWCKARAKRGSRFSNLKHETLRRPRLLILKASKFEVSSRIRIQSHVATRNFVSNREGRDPSRDYIFIPCEARTTIVLSGMLRSSSFLRSRPTNQSSAIIPSAYIDRDHSGT
jgi:hypothetical protein